MVDLQKACGAGSMPTPAGLRARAPHLWGGHRRPAGGLHGGRAQRPPGAAGRGHVDDGQGSGARHSSVGQVPHLLRGAGDGAAHPVGLPALGISVPDMDAVGAAGGQGAAGTATHMYNTPTPGAQPTGTAHASANRNQAGTTGRAARPTRRAPRVHTHTSPTRGPRSSTATTICITCRRCGIPQNACRAGCTPTPVGLRARASRLRGPTATHICTTHPHSGTTDQDGAHVRQRRPTGGYAVHRTAG